VDVDRTRRADAESHKCRPVNDASLLAKLNQLHYGIGMEKTHVGCLDLPRLMLSCLCKFR
jgi:hypothetical protein